MTIIACHFSENPTGSFLSILFPCRNLSRPVGRLLLGTDTNEKRKLAIHRGATCYYQKALC
jgi:hypothetical protein